jgi:hypothetical protein
VGFLLRESFSWVIWDVGEDSCDMSHIILTKENKQTNKNSGICIVCFFLRTKFEVFGSQKSKSIHIEKAKLLGHTIASKVLL